MAASEIFLWAMVNNVLSPLARGTSLPRRENRLLMIQNKEVCSYETVKTILAFSKLSSSCLYNKMDNIKAILTNPLSLAILKSQSHLPFFCFLE